MCVQKFGKVYQRNGDTNGAFRKHLYHHQIIQRNTVMFFANDTRFPFTILACLPWSFAWCEDWDVLTLNPLPWFCVPARFACLLYAEFCVNATPVNVTCSKKTSGKEHRGHEMRNKSGGPVPLPTCSESTEFISDKLQWKVGMFTTKWLVGDMGAERDSFCSVSARLQLRISMTETPLKYAFLHCGHLNFESAVTTPNGNCKGSFDSLSSCSLNVKTSPRNSIRSPDTYR